MLIFAPVLAQLNSKSMFALMPFSVSIVHARLLAGIMKQKTCCKLKKEKKKQLKILFFYVFCCCFTRRTLAEYLMEIYSVNKVESHVWMMSGAGEEQKRVEIVVLLFFLLMPSKWRKFHLDAHHDLAGRKKKPESDFDPIFVIRISKRKKKEQLFYLIYFYQIFCLLSTLEKKKCRLIRILCHKYICSFDPILLIKVTLKAV